MSISFMIGRSTITVFMDGAPHTVDESHMNYAQLKAELRKPDAAVARDDEQARDMDVVRGLVSVRRFIEAQTYGGVTVGDDCITYKGEVVSNYMTERMLELVQEGMDIKPWALFMDNLMLNPSKAACDELYQWLEGAKMPITPDGHFLAFKKVRENYTDVHTGKFDNSPGSILSMPREKCDTNRHNHCSTGFHFCSVSYLGNFGGNRVMVVKINPRDVTSIPADYSFTKGRCSDYEVLRELVDTSSARDAVWKKPVVDVEDPAELPADLLVAFDPPKKATKPKKKKAAAKPKKKAAPKAKAKVKAKKKPARKPAVSTVTRVKVGKPKTSKMEFVSKGTTFTKTQIKKAMKANPSVRAAARELGIGESTLRGWNKRISA